MKILFFLLLISAAICHAQSTAPPHNSRIFPSSITQTEPVIAISPVNPLIMFASAVTINTNNGFRSEGVYVSTNGGVSWRGNDTCTGSYIGNHGGDPGIAVSPNGSFVLTHIGSVFAGVYSHYSTDLGKTWSAAYTISSDQPEDKGSTAMDNAPASPYFGRIYSSWVDFVPPYSVLFSRSTDNGKNWSAAAPMYTPASSHCSGGYVKTGADGTIYVCWALLSETYPFIEDSVGIAVSTDGGSSWKSSHLIYDMNGINGTVPSKNNIRVNGLPQLDIDRSGGERNGWIYIVTTEQNRSPAGSDPDIILHHSTDGGNTWSQGTRVNRDSSNDGKVQYFPSINVDSTGNVIIIYYDDRNTSADSAEIMLSRSGDGGGTWTERVISDHRFQPKPILGGPSTYQGDHIALTTADNKLFAFWMDDYSGVYQIWSAAIDGITLGVNQSPLTMPGDFVLYQNYPNPFNPSTTIRYRVDRISNVEIIVYDILGKELATLVHGTISPGEYRASWNAGSAPSGIYYVSLIASDGQGRVLSRNVRKMLLVK